MTLKLATEQKSTKAADFFEAVADLAVELYGRWLDERDYEDINDYRKVFADVAASFGVTIVKMTKSPFGFEFSVDGKDYRFAVTLKTVGYQRINHKKAR